MSLFGQHHKQLPAVYARPTRWMHEHRELPSLPILMPIQTNPDYRRPQWTNDPDWPRRDAEYP